jgi:hypothetical protein
MGRSRRNRCGYSSRNRMGMDYLREALAFFLLRLVFCAAGAFRHNINGTFKPEQILFFYLGDHMSRKSFLSIHPALPKGGMITIGGPALGQRPALEALIAKSIMTFSVAEAEMSLVLGQLLGTNNDAALAVFQTLRRASNQREAISAASEIALLQEGEHELVAAMLDVHKSIEAERTALAHGNFGVIDSLPDAILWMTSKDYVHLKARLHLRNEVLTEEIKNGFYASLSYYRKPDLESVYEATKFCAAMWPDAVNWLRSRDPRRAELFHLLRSQSRIAEALNKPRRENTA